MQAGYARRGEKSRATTASDVNLNLDAEIQPKFNRGYPRDNILFEDSQTAVLFQNREEAMRVDMTNAAPLQHHIPIYIC